MTLEERYWKKVDVRGDDECWPWLASKKGLGYGMFRTTYPETAHRTAWRLANGEIPDGLHVLHKCDVPECQNPNHLFVGTNAENTADKVAKGRCSRLVRPGEENPNSKLTAEQVRIARYWKSLGNMTRTRIAKHFGIGNSQMSRILNNQSWIVS